MTLENTRTYKDFIFSRFSRLFPTYWVCVTITAILTITWKYVVKMPITFPTLKDYFINLTMIQYYFGVNDIDGPYWTLCIELFFYLLMLTFLLSNTLRKIEIIGFCIVLTSLIYGTIIRLYFPRVYELLNFYIPFLSYSHLFFAGIIFYKVKFNKATLIRYLILLFCLIVQIAIYTTRVKVHIALSNSEYSLALSSFFIIFYLYYLNKLSYILNPVSLFLGKISYSLYLIHQ